MKKKGKIIGLLTLIVTICALVLLAARHNCRVKARAEADRIITFQFRPAEGQISKAITSLLATKSWIRDMTKQDFQRVERLCDMRNEKQKSRRHYLRAMHGARADRIIAGEQPAYEGEIDTIIVGLQMTTVHAQIVLEQDSRRLQQLTDVSNEIRKSQGLPPWPPWPPRLPGSPWSSDIDPNRPAAPPDSNQGK